MTRGATVMVVLTFAASVVNYASNLIFSRLLNPAEFGDLTAVLAFAVLAGVPTAAAQTMIAERVARHAAQNQLDEMRWFVRHAVGRVVTAAAMVGVLYALALPLVIDLLEMRAPGPAIALLPLIVLTFILPVALGVLQGLDRFIAFGLMALAIALSRIVFGVPWAATGGGSGGAVGGQALGLLVVLIAAAWILRDQIAPRGSGAATSGLKQRPGSAALSASAAFIAFAVISNLDILLAKLFLDSHETGLYAALVTIEKIVIFLPGAVAIVMVPNAARARHSPEASRRVLRLAALLVLAATLLAAIPSALAPESLVRVMFGSEYLGAEDGVVPIVVAGAGLALLYLLVTYAVAIGDRRWTWIVVAGVALQVAGIAAFHADPAQVATVQAAVVVLVLLLNEAAFHSLLRTQRVR